MTLSQFENELTIHEHTQAGTLDEFHRAYEAEVDDIRPISGRLTLSGSTATRSRPERHSPSRIRETRTRSSGSSQRR